MKVLENDDIKIIIIKNYFYNFNNINIKDSVGYIKEKLGLSVLFLNNTLPRPAKSHSLNGFAHILFVLRVRLFIDSTAYESSKLILSAFEHT